MHGSGGEEWKQSRHMWPVPSNATTVAPDSSPSEFICKDGRKIRVGDCALFKPPQDFPPFIGIIRKLTLDKEENPSFQVNWLYRPADLKLAKGIVLEAAPNEVFYSFHKDVTPAASLLHPCKVAFLRKGVELPSGISAFVCRRVYDIENNCLWWLTDKDYLNEHQEEVNQLLDKTKLEMHGAVQSGGRSPKPLNGPTSTQSLKSGSDNIQNSSSFAVQGKGKKRERGDQGSESSKKERLLKVEDGDSGQCRPESMLKSEIAKITEKGGLVDFEGVERLVQLMQPDSADKKIDLAGRIMLVDVIALTERYECLGRFVQLRGLPVLDEWLQEVHKGKIGDGNMPKESDKSVEEFLLALLRALDKLPVNLHALQTCNVGKSVNHLRTHKNSEIQRKARSLVDTWKRRVEAEMNMNDSKSGSTRAVSWPAKPAASEVSHLGNRKTGGSSENVSKSSAIQSSVSKNSQAKLSSGEALSKSSSSPGSTKSITTSLGSNSKDQNIKVLVGAATSDLPLTPIKEERSSSSSQSQNNSISYSSEHAKTIGSCREDAKNSTAVSMSVSKIPGGASRTRKSSNGLHGAGVAVVQKEHSSAKNSTRNSPSEKVSPTQVSREKSPDQPVFDQGNNQRLILRLPNTGRSPSRGASGVSFEEPGSTCGKASPPADKNENQDRRVKAKTDCLQTHVSNMINDACDANETLTSCDEGKGSPMVDERCRANEDGDKVAEMSKPTSSSSGFIPRSGQTYDASLSPMNALVESCVKFSEASASVSPGDDGMNLLATVAAGEISRSENVSPRASPERKSPSADESSSGNESKLKHSGEAAPHTLGQSDGAVTGEHPLNTVTTTLHDISGDGEAVSSSCIEKAGDGRTQINLSSTDLLQNAEGQCLRPETKEDASETILPAKQETHAEPGGADHFPEQRELGSQWSKSNSNSDSKLKSRTTTFDDNQKIDRMDDGITENEKMLASKAVASVNIENELGEKSPELSSGVNNDSQTSAEKVTGTGISVQNASPFAENCESRDFKKEDVTPPASGNAFTVCRDENAEDMKPVDVEPNEKRMDLDSVVSDGVNECPGDNLGRKEVHPDLPTIPGKENEVAKTCESNLDGNQSEVAGEWHACNVNPSLTGSGSDASVKLDFDLNEGFPVEDASQGEIVRQEEPITSSAVHVPCPLPFPISSISGGFHASITVASAAKGPVVPPENPLRSKGELGWKGSAATSAFRPAEPRKNPETPSSTSDIPSVDAASVKQGRPPLDFDLNVADERSFEDVAARGSLESGHDRSPVGLDLDLNRVDETPEAGYFSMSKLDIPSFPSKPSLSSGLSNGGSVSRDFDLNNGPGLDEVGTEVPSRSQQMKSTAAFSTAVHGTRTNNAEIGSYSSWFPQGNSYSAITVPPLLPGRGEQSYVAGPGAQRIIGPAGSTPFGPEIYRGPVLSSSPAVAYPPTTPFPYPGFPFETNFPLSSNSFSGCSTAFMDSSTVGGLCFPTMPSQPVGPGVVSSTYPRPYVMSLPGGTSNVIPDSRKWGSQSLDLNSGPGGTDTERRDDRLPSGLRQISVPSSQALMEDQLKMFQMAGALKRKEPEGGWDGADRFSSYKQPSWQ
ncbi:Transcription elongation factor, TFIIS/CRSP70, N-terminal, sub-type [Sesbania bispinosa]|nr:Transcription elongation factor, TFIIS/CRSP70, N-terminal, sub-type [Sesbania bispinosa]